jgi:type VI secretion system secreted protein Hcp
MKRFTVRRLAPPVLAALVTSVVVAAIAVGGQKTQAAGGAASPPNPSGQTAGQLAIDGKTIPILSYSLGASNPATIGTGSGGGSGKVSFSSLNMLKAVDANSPAFFLAVARGQHFPVATFTAQWGTAAASATMSYRLEDVLVESVQHSGGGGGAPTESLSLAFAKVTWTYTDASGSTSGSWNLTTNSE